MTAAFDFSTGGQSTSAQRVPADQRMWYFGGQQAGPAPATNPIRQGIGNFVESIGNAIPGLGEGYISEWIAGGPTRNTRAYASDYVTPPTTDNDGGSPTGGRPTNTNRAPSNNNNNSGKQSITEQEAIGLGLDWNNLPGQYSRNEGGGNGGGGFEISDRYQPYLNELLNIEGSLRGSANEAGKNVESSYTSGLGNLENEQGDLISGLQLQEQKVQRGGSSALDDARRAYNALIQQGRSQYGGGSSVGQALGELIGQEYARSGGNIRQQTQEGMQQLALEAHKVKTYIGGKKTELENWKKNALIGINQQLQSSLNDIALRRGDIESNKAKDRQTALQDAIQRTRDIQDRDTQFRQNLAQFAVETLQNNSQRTFTPQEIAGIVSDMMGAEIKGFTTQTPTYVAPKLARSGYNEDELKKATSAYGTT